MSGITVVAKLTGEAEEVRLAVDTSDEFASPVYSSPVAPNGRVAKLSVTGLDADTAYYCAVEIDGELDLGAIGTFRTLPASGPASFKCAFSGDANSGSNAAVFSQILAQDPLFFIHLGDMHYDNISSNSVALFEAAYDEVLSQPNQAALYQHVPTIYIWDDHDFGPNDSHGGSASRDAACEAYRLRVPHPPLVENGTTDAVYYTYQVGRVLFIVTDQRSMASPAAATDNSSKTILGDAQKAWFKDLLSDPDNADKLFVWVCSRTWGGVATSGADHWGGFTTERTELADHIKEHCADRFCVLSADMHSLAIDDGTNHDFATGGGAPIPTFQASPLDRTGAETWGGATYSEGGRFTNNGQFGVMEITDTGGTTIGVSWKGYDLDGGLLVQYDWDATVAAPLGVSWDPMAKSSRVALADDNLKAYSNTGTTNATGNVRSSKPLTGKAYISALVVSNGSDAVGFGIVREAWDYSNESKYVGSETGVGVGLWVSGGNVYGASVGSAGASGSEQVEIAVDCDTREVWIRLNGDDWLGGGDPAAGTSPTATLGGDDPLYAAAGIVGGNESSRYVLLNVTPETTSGDAPAGFTAANFSP